MGRTWGVALAVLFVLVVVLVSRPEWFMAALGLVFFLPLLAIGALTAGVWVARKLRI